MNLKTLANFGNLAFLMPYNYHDHLMKLEPEKSSKKLYAQIVRELIPLYSKEEAGQLGKMLLEDVLSIPFEKVMIDEQIDITLSKTQLLFAKLDLLRKYFPIQYVLGKAHFYGRDFYVDPNVLIPRQETEELVNEIIIDNKRSNLKVLDIGSGSGIIGITLGLELAEPEITALDVQQKALDITTKNAKTFGVEINSLVEDILLMERLPEKYDIIVSNPPYITEKEKKEMLNNVLEHEPHHALFVPDEDPLRFYKKIIALAKSHLEKKGKLYVEINQHYGAEMIRLYEKEGCSYLQLIKDLNGKDRIIKAMFD